MADTQPTDAPAPPTFVWTAEAARKRFMPSDAAMAKFAPFHDDAARRKIEQMADSLGIARPKIVETSDPKDHGVALVSKEGNTYVKLYSGLSQEAAVAIGAHELGHLKNGDVTAEKIVASIIAPDHDAFVLEEEKKADQTAIDLGEGYQLAAMLIEWDTIKDRKDMANFKLDPDDPTHPSPHTRIATLYAGARQAEIDGKYPVDPNLRIDKDIIKAFLKIDGGESTSLTAQQAAGAQPVGAKPAPAQGQGASPPM